MNLADYPLEAILGPSRKRETAYARHVAMYALHEQGMSYMAIGRAMGRDHSTVMWGVAKIAAEMKTRLETQQEVTELLWLVNKA